MKSAWLVPWTKGSNNLVFACGFNHFAFKTPNFPQKIKTKKKKNHRIFRRFFFNWTFSLNESIIFFDLINVNCLNRNIRVNFFFLSFFDSKAVSNCLKLKSKSNRYVIYIKDFLRELSHSASVRLKKICLKESNVAPVWLANINCH